LSGGDPSRAGRQQLGRVEQVAGDPREAGFYAAPEVRLVGVNRIKKSRYSPGITSGAGWPARRGTTPLQRVAEVAGSKRPVILARRFHREPLYRLSLRDTIGAVAQWEHDDWSIKKRGFICRARSYPLRSRRPHAEPPLGNYFDPFTPSGGDPFHPLSLTPMQQRYVKGHLPRVFQSAPSVIQPRFHLIQPLSPISIGLNLILLWTFGFFALLLLRHRLDFFRHLDFKMSPHLDYHREHGRQTLQDRLEKLINKIFD